jgi:hypothetical protein
VRGKHTIAAAIATAVALAAPAAANAAALTASPLKSCYRAGERLTLGGSGYTPNQGVAIASDVQPLGRSIADPGGNFSGTLRVAVPSGEKVKTYSATDESNPANTAAVQLRVSALTVNLRPRSGRPSRRFRIGARGFTTGKVLYAHIVRKGFRRNVRIGRLRGRCHKVSARKRLFGRNIATGFYRVQFDGKRRYSRKTKVKVVRGFRVAPRSG